MQVGQYGPGELGYDRERRNSGPYAANQYRGSDASYYGPPPQSYQGYDDRPSSRGSRRERERSRDRGEKHGHEAEKSIGATLLGGAVGGCKFETHLTFGSVNS